MAQTVHPTVLCIFAPPVSIPLEVAESPGLAVPQLVMLANVALTGEGGACGYDAEGGGAEEGERQMVELTTVGSGGYTDSEEEEGAEEEEGDGLMGRYEFRDHLENSVQTADVQPEALLPSAEEEEEDEEEEEGEQWTKAPPDIVCPPPAGKRKQGTPTEDSRKKKLFHCKPCQYQAENEKDFVHHIRVHGNKKLAAVAATEGEELRGQAGPEVVASANGEGTGAGAAHSKGVIRCERCGYNTNRYDHYLAHLKHHSKEGDSQEVFRCTICPYTTVSQYHWKKHLRNHFPSKLYTCAECCYFSDRKNNYVQHIRTHTGERPFHCLYCEYTSSQKTHLTRHMRTHSGEKPFKCDNCSYVAANQHEVTRHVRQVHGGPKPLSCPHCSYKTADRSNYKKHVELHVNPRQFLCPVCSYAASKKCNLQYHIKSRHPDSTEVTMDVSKVRLRVKNLEPGIDGNAGRKKSRNDVLLRTPEEDKCGGGEEVGAGFREEEQEEEEDEDSSDPINLSIKRTGKAASGRVAEKEKRKEQGVPRYKKEEGLQEKGSVNKGEEGTENKVKKPKDQATPERRKERIGGKVAKVSGAVRTAGVEKRVQREPAQSEPGTDQGSDGTTKRVERKAVKTSPKRKRKLGKMADDVLELGEEGRAEGPAQEETKKANKRGRKRKSATKRAAKTERDVVGEMAVPSEVLDNIPDKTPKKGPKIKVGKRKANAVETSPPGREVSEQPVSAVRSKRKRLEDAAIVQSPVRLPKGRKAKKRKETSRQKAETKKALPVPLGLPEVEPELANKGTVLSPGVDAGGSAQDDVSPVVEFKLVLEEEEELKEVEDSGYTISQHQDPEANGALTQPGLEEEEPAPQADHTAAQQLEHSEGESEPNGTLESCGAGEEGHSPTQVAPAVATGPRQLGGKKALSPLELPRAREKPADAEEDEGIHSPTGSEISDSISEGSDDSGLNGLTGSSTPTDSPEVLTKQDTPTEECPSPTHECPSPTEECPSPTHECSSPTEENLSPAKGSPSPTEKLDTPIEECPSPTKKNISHLDELNTPTVESPSSTDKVDISTKEGPSPSENSTSPIEKSPTVLEGSPSLIDKDHSPMHESLAPAGIGHTHIKKRPELIEMADAPMQESHTPTKLPSHTCIFCDRTFPIELDYRRHLNRHLVNVYYLETTASDEQ